ncbi:hypothetical protein UFOVP119_53 [uncultured Caudovirales phage]|uniref:Uncharacterized protein n=1 Tax=uncultured Caudovirales phage TaxID=2100421 RepID=A0A6J5LFL4_9CAUD|nr:hypothetical protein UFOVP119_53 [uncultured Caudovirales phage]
MSIDIIPKRRKLKGFDYVKGVPVEQIGSEWIEQIEKLKTPDVRRFPGVVGLSPDVGVWHKPNGITPQLAMEIYDV